MKIRQRLTLIFTLTIAGVLFTLSTIIYFVSKGFHEKEFNQQLDLRLDRTEKFFLETTGLPNDLAQQIRELYLQKLPQEIEWALDPDKPFPEELAPYLNGKINFLLQGNKLWFSHDHRQGVARIYELNNKRHLIVVTALDQFGISKLANLRRILLIAFPLGLTLAAFIGWFTTKKALTPLEVNIAQARQISATNLSTRLALPNQKDEIYDFAVIFNELLQRIETAFSFQQTFISNASHEIRNPLTVIAGEAEIALSATRTVEAYQESLEIISHEADRLNELVNNLLSLAKTGGEGLLTNRELIPVGKILSEVRKVIVQSWPDQHIIWPQLNAAQLKIQLPCNLLMLRSALVNILDNACKYGHNNPVEWQISFIEHTIHFTFKDTGIGIPDKELPMVLVPLFRASNARSFSGQGIGLPLVDRIVRMHGGTLDIQSEPGVGTVVTVVLGLANS
ncbi:MAG: hypothetical protein KA479_04805 [Saprospiraceae bacterium]|nr:hypothetical protein [Saprospiraceae bacterium]